MDSLTLTQILIAWVIASLPVSVFVGYCIFCANNPE